MQVLVTLPYMSYLKKDYILDISDKDAGLNAAQWLALFVVVDLMCLKYLPLLTKCAVMGFFLCEFKFKVVI
jgi:hypothetical protein